MKEVLDFYNREQSAVTQEKIENVQESAVRMVREAMTSLQSAHNLLVQHNPMAADVPVVQELQKVAKNLQPTLQGIAKLRGIS